MDSEAERDSYRIDIDQNGLFHHYEKTVNGKYVTGELINTGRDGWIFVVKNGRLYAGEKQTKVGSPRYVHRAE